MPYCPLVFSLPHEINALAGVHARWVYDPLMQCTASPALRSRDAPKTPCATPKQDRAQRHQIASRQRWLTPPATQAILRYMVKYKASGMDRTFSALADPTRRDVLLRLREEPGLSVSELARPFSQKLPGMMKHLDVLSYAGLITRTKTGRTVSVQLSVGPMREAMEWLERYERFWTVSIDRLVALVEEDGER